MANLFGLKCKKEKIKLLVIGVFIAYSIESIVQGLTYALEFIFK